MPPENCGNARERAADLDADAVEHLDRAETCLAPAEVEVLLHHAGDLPAYWEHGARAAIASWNTIRCSCPHLRPLGLGELEQVSAVEISGLRDEPRPRDEPRDREGRHALAATDSPDQPRDLAAIDRQRHTGHGVEQSAFRGEGDRQAIDVKHFGVNLFGGWLAEQRPA